MSPDESDMSQLLMSHKVSEIHLVEFGKDSLKKTLSMIDQKAVKNYRGDLIVLDVPQGDIKAIQDALKLKDFMFSKVENIHALEPNYLRSDI